MLREDKTTAEKQGKFLVPMVSRSRNQEIPTQESSWERTQPGCLQNLEGLHGRSHGTNGWDGAHQTARGKWQEIQDNLRMARFNY